MQGTPPAQTVANMLVEGESASNRIPQNVGGEVLDFLVGASLNRSDSSTYIHMYMYRYIPHGWEPKEGTPSF